MILLTLYLLLCCTSSFTRFFLVSVNDNKTSSSDYGVKPSKKSDADAAINTTPVPKPQTPLQRVPCNELENKINKARVRRGGSCTINLLLQILNRKYLLKIFIENIYKKLYLIVQNQ